MIEQWRQHEVPSPYEWRRDDLEIAVRDGGGYAFRPGQVLARGEDAVEFIQAITRSDLGRRRLGDVVRDRLDGKELPDDFIGLSMLDEWWQIDGVGDVVGVVNAGRSAGYVIQPNHVLFADNCSCGCPCPPHPSLANDLEGLVGNPLKANPLKANPLKANPLKANPLKANPLKANPLKANSLADNKPPVSSAAPGDAPKTKPVTLAVTDPLPRVVIFDSGLATEQYRPPLIGGANVEFYQGDVPDTGPPIADGYLDPVAGHGTFIAGIVEQHCPGTALLVHKVLSPLGDVDEVALVAAVLWRLIDDLIQSKANTWRSTIFNISIGGYLRDDGGLLAEMMGLVHSLGIVVVASAGNLGACRPAYPAAFPTVIGVGALGPWGPADYTNYGPWVDACAPGTDLDSAFFTAFDGKNPPINGVDIDKFTGWAVWTGTSFAAPTVVAALVREMRIRDIVGRAAVDLVIDGPGRTRIPNLGTIVTC